MEGVFEFLAGTTGRVVRVIAGLVLIALGIWVAESTIWTWVLIIVGLVPLVAGVVDVCVFAPLFGLPFSGDQLRARHGRA
jgi:hypothetical protein